MAATALGSVVTFIGGGFLLKLYTHFDTIDTSTSVRYISLAFIYAFLCTAQSIIHNLHYLLPTKRDCQVTDRLRSSNKYPVVRARTDRCKRSFIMHSLHSNFSIFVVNK